MELRFFVLRFKLCTCGVELKIRTQFFVLRKWHFLGEVYRFTFWGINFESFSEFQFKDYKF